MLTIIFFVWLYKYSEDRYLICLIPALSILIINLFYNPLTHLITKNKNIIFIIPLILILLLSITQINTAKDIINNRKTSFLSIKEAGEFIEKNTPKTSNILITSNQMELAAYVGERKIVKGQGENLTEFNSLVNDYNITHLVLSFIYPQDPPKQWLLEDIQNQISQGSNRYQIIFRSYLDANKKVPGSIVIKLN